MGSAPMKPPGWVPPPDFTPRKVRVVVRPGPRGYRLHIVTVAT